VQPGAPRPDIAPSNNNPVQCTALSGALCEVLELKMELRRKSKTLRHNILFRVEALAGIESTFVGTKTDPAAVEVRWKALRIYCMTHPDFFDKRQETKGLPDAADYEIKVGTDNLRVEQIIFALQCEIQGPGPLRILWFPNRKSRVDFCLTGSPAIMYPSIVDFWLNRNGEFFRNEHFPEPIQEKEEDFSGKKTDLQIVKTSDMRAHMGLNAENPRAVRSGYGNPYRSYTVTVHALEHLINNGFVVLENQNERKNR
jgi:hypothetical protein